MKDVALTLELLKEVVPSESSDTERAIMVEVFRDQGHLDEVFDFYARAFLHEGRPIAAVGVTPCWPGRGQAWTILSDEVIRDHGLSLTRMTRWHLNDVTERGKLRRIEATVRAGHRAGHRWMHALGFKREGLMRRYGPEGEDHHLYARLR